MGVNVLTLNKYMISKFIAKYRETGSIGRRTGSGRPSKITAEVKEILEEQMQADDKTSAHQLHRLLKSRGYNISLCTILRCRMALGWTFRGSSYCQLIRHANKQKWLDCAERHTDLAFNDVVWTDECTVQLESHRRFCCRKRGQPAKNKPRYTECVAVVFIVGILWTCTCYMYMYKRDNVFTYVAVPGRNRTLFRCVFCSHCCVRSALAWSFR